MSAKTTQPAPVAVPEKPLLPWNPFVAVFEGDTAPAAAERHYQAYGRVGPCIIKYCGDHPLAPRR